jgi:hypothetical protein
LIVNEEKHVDHNYGHRGQRHGYAGKPREQYHPYDRHDGTGRGHRGPKNAGYGNSQYKVKGEADPEPIE